MTEEETEYDEVYECSHSYNTRCTTSYTTTYEAQQEEECEDNYKKSCFIEYSQTAYNDIESVVLFGVFRRLKTPIFGVFRPLK